MNECEMTPNVLAVVAGEPTSYKIAYWRNDSDRARRNKVKPKSGK